MAGYSMRHIKFASDRFPALAGIASEFANISEDRPLFGLWSNDLHAGLLFYEDLDMPCTINNISKSTWQ
jgi:hypothetical protein